MKRNLFHGITTELTNRTPEMSQTPQNPYPPSKKKYSIFIGCISGQTTSKDLKKKYSEISRIFDIKIRRKKKNAGSGYATFSTHSFELFQFLISTPQEILGRKVTCRPDLKGRDRRKQQNLLNSRRIFIRGLNLSWTDEKIYKLFNSYFKGKIERAYAIRDSFGNSRGFGYVNFTDAVQAKNAIGKKKLKLEGFNVKCQAYSKPRENGKKKGGLKSDFNPSRICLKNLDSNKRKWKPMLDFETKEPLKCTYFSKNLDLRGINHQFSNLRINFAQGPKKLELER